MTPQPQFAPIKPRPILRLRSGVKRRARPQRQVSPERAKKLRFEQAWLAVEWMERTFPAINLAQPVPLAVGALKSIQRAPHPGFSNKSIRLAMSIYTSRRAYRQAVAAEGAIRHSLCGTEGVLVSEAHREHAQSQLSRGI